MSFKVAVERSLLIERPPDGAVSDTIQILNRYAYPPSFQETSDGYAFWLYGNLNDGSSGSVRFIPSGRDSERTKALLSLEVHQSRGGLLEALLSKVGLGKQARSIVRAIVHSPEPTSGASEIGIPG